MLISPLKAPLKPPSIEGYFYGLLSDRNATIGNSLHLVETEARELMFLKIFGETLATPADPEQEVSPDNPQTLTSQTSFDYSVNNGGALSTTATITLKDTSDNQLENRGIPSGYATDGTPTFAAQDYVFKDTDGKWKLYNTTQNNNITAVDTFLSVYTSTDCACFRGALAYPNPTFTTGAVGICNNFKLNNGVILSATTSDEAFVVGGGAPNYQQFYIKIKKSRLTGWNDSLTDAEKVALMNTWLSTHTTVIICKRTTPTTTELCTADQTALNSVAKTFAGITNIMLSTNIGQVQVEQWSKAAMR